MKLNRQAIGCLIFVAGSGSAKNFEWPQTASCNAAAEQTVARAFTNCAGNPATVPMLVSQQQCYLPDVPLVKQIRQELLQVISPPVEHIKTNFKEMITPEMYKIQAAEGLESVERITADVDGEFRMTISGQVDAYGDVPVVIDGFALESVGKMRKSVAKIYIKIRFNNVVIRGKYNIHTGQLTALPELSTMQAAISHDVSIPFVFKLLKELTPKLVMKLQQEIATLAEKIAKAVGVKLTYDVPAAIEYHSRVNPTVVAPIKALQGKKAGDKILYQLILDSYSHITLNHDTESLQSVWVPFCPY